MREIHITAAQTNTDAESAHVARSQRLADEFIELSLSNLLAASEELVATLAEEFLNDQEPSANVADPLAGIDVGTGRIDDIDVDGAGR